MGKLGCDVLVQVQFYEITVHLGGNFKIKMIIYLKGDTGRDGTEQKNTYIKQTALKNNSSRLVARKNKI